MSGALTDIPQRLQDIPPKWAHFCLHTEQFIADDLGVDLRGKNVVIGVSGGADSTALLLILHYLSQKNGTRIVVAHLDHQLRSESADDARWVRDLCGMLNVECISETCDVQALAEKKDVGVEEAGREARYALYQRVLEAEDADHIALGHHLGDLCEDVLMRLIRGTGWPGLSGMVGHDPERKLIRPLLLTNKADLTLFLTDIGVTWREDASNASPEWTRNRVRNDILPLFIKENPNFPEAVARLWKLGRLENGYWAELTQGASESLSSTVLDEAHQALRLRLYKACLDRLGTGQALADTLFKLDKAWGEKRIGATFQFPGEKRATITVSGVVFSRSH